MQSGFWHPERGYWQTNDTVTDDIVRGYPPGTVNVPLQPGPDHSWSGETWVQNPPDVVAERSKALATMVSWISRFLSQFTAGVPPEEIASWPTKSIAAQAHIAGEPQDIIIGEALLTGEDPDVLAAAIWAKSQRYIAIIARMTGLRRMSTNTIAAATTADDVAAALAASMAAATQILADIGLSQES